MSLVVSDENNFAAAAPLGCVPRCETNFVFLLQRSDSFEPCVAFCAADETDHRLPPREPPAQPRGPPIAVDARCATCSQIYERPSAAS